MCLNLLFMELRQEQFDQIKNILPVQRGNASISNFAVLQAILCGAEQGCKWLGKMGSAQSYIYGTAKEKIIRVKVETVSLDSAIVKVHPDGTGALKKTVFKPLGNHGEDGLQRFIWLPQMLERQ